MHTHLHDLAARFHYKHTYAWALLLSCLVVAITATLARATLNLAGALTRKPDIAVLLLLPEEHITDSELIRAQGDERDYMIETETVPKLARLKKGGRQWYVQEVVKLRQ